MQTNDPGQTERYRVHAELCKVLTDPKRLMILDALRHEERTVGELAEAIGVTLPNASQHLAVMRNAGLVEGRRVGTTVIYRLAEPTIVDACDIVQRIVARKVASRPAPPTRSSSEPADYASQR
jgi:ArsR family transcriptional regulator